MWVYSMCQIHVKAQKIKNLQSQHFTQFIKFVVTKHLIRLNDFIWEPGDFLSLLIFLTVSFLYLL